MQTIVPQSILRSVGPPPNKQGAEIPNDSVHRRNRDGVEDGDEHMEMGLVSSPAIPRFFRCLPRKGKTQSFTGASGKSELSLGRPRSHGGV